MILSDTDIKKALSEDRIAIEPCSGAFEPASYDLRVGNLAITKTEVVKLEKEDHVTIPRGETAVIYPMESIRLDCTLVGKFGLISKYARKGLILLSGPQIDPGYDGSLEITVFNAGNRGVDLAFGETFATIEFEQLTSKSSRPYAGPYQHRERASGEIIDIIQSRKKSFAEYEEEFEDLRRAVQTTQSQFAHVTKLNTVVVGTIIFGVVFGILFALVKKLLDWVWVTP